MVLSELIKEYKEMCLEDVPVEEILEDLQKLEGIYKPKDVPQFVVDWYETYKDNLEYSIWEWMRYEPNREKNKKFFLWLNDASNNPVQTLVKMKLFDYKVKEEKRYIVKVKNVYKNSSYLNYYKDKDRWVFVDGLEAGSHRVEHTKDELKNAGFTWVFNCPGIEIEEVE